MSTLKSLDLSGRDIDLSIPPPRGPLIKRYDGVSLSVSHLLDLSEIATEKKARQ